MAASTVMFRCDADIPVGVGHVMRCLTLADMLASRGWQCAFRVCAAALEAVPALASCGHDVVFLSEAERWDAAALRRHRPHGVDVLVIDHYGLAASYEEACRPWARRILVIDDLADRPHQCDVLLDQTVGRQAADYAGRVPAGTRMLLGTEYALLRPQFVQHRPAALTRHLAGAAVRKVLVSLGGTDPGNATGLVLDALDSGRLECEVIVLLGRGAPALPRLRADIDRLNIPVQLREGVSNVAEIMAECDLAVGAAGTSAWERCCLGIPSAVLVTADNQQFVAQRLRQEGAALVLGRVEDLDAAGLAAAVTALAADGEGRREMAKRAAALCDGDGAVRVAEVLEQYRLRVRPAEWSDSDDLLEWRNDPETRANARNTEMIGIDSHRTWLSSVLGDPLIMLMIGEEAGQKVGTVRFDLRDQIGWEASITVAPEFRGRRRGADLLIAGIDALLRRQGPTPVRAVIRSANQASRRIFEAAGFTLLSEGDGWCTYRRPE